MTMTLSGRIIVVTGAGRGLGQAFAEGCAAAGAAAVVVADINATWGERTAAVLKSKGTDAVFLPVDLADPASVEGFAAAVAKRPGNKSGRASCRERVCQYG